MSDRNSEIIRRAAAGETYASIARDFYITRTRVMQICMPALGRRKAPPKNIQPICPVGLRRLHASGLRNNDIADTLGCSSSGIALALRRLGLHSNFQVGPLPASYAFDAVRLVATGLTYSAVAERLKITRGQVAGAVYRARQSQARLS